MSTKCAECGTEFIGHANGKSRYCRPSCKNRRANRVKAERVEDRRCEFPGCDRRYYAKGHCKPHYDQVRLGREYREVETRTSGPVQERLDAYTDKTDGCWLWVGACNDRGYGQLSVEGALQYTHRLSYEASVGAIPPGMELDHLCRTRNCLRPDHLEIVTPDENKRRAREHTGLPPRRNGRWATS